MAFLAVHNPEWGFNCESKVFFAVYSLIRKLPASHHSPVPSRDASVLQSNLPLNCEKKNLLKCFSVVIIKNTIKVWPWYPEETFVSPTKDNNRLLGYLWGPWVDLWGFSLFFWLLYFSASTFLCFGILAFVYINCLALNKCWESHSWKLTYLNMDYMSLCIKFFFPQIKYLYVWYVSGIEQKRSS